MSFRTYWLSFCKFNGLLKQKLKNRRKKRGFSQEAMAHKLNMEQSQYSRRENGKTVISTKEWVEMAKILDTTVEKIYEPHDGVYIMKYENTSDKHTGNPDRTQNEYVLDIQKKYIIKLEEENIRLREEIESLKK